MADVNTIRTSAGTRTAAIDAGLRAHMNKVYGTMSVGMLITFAAAWAISGLAVTGVATEYQIRADKYLTDFGYALYASPLKWVVMLAPLAMVFFLSFRINSMSVGAAQLTFWIYSALVGLSLSSIFLVFTAQSITQTFFVTAAAFGADTPGEHLYTLVVATGDLTSRGTFHPEGGAYATEAPVHDHG